MNSIKRIPIVVFLFILTACGGETAVSPPSPITLPTATLPPPVLSEPSVPETATVAENEVAEGVETAVSTPSAQAAPPTEEPLPTATIPPEPTVVLVQSGRTEGGGYFLGNPDAPITFIDYSDFM